ncbi:MAG TPA: ribosome small subunit-dependent GTPase A, partial [Spirochaetota bacterium]|nr:ribosome small subunit-dependent GTPase A [Spirochaetota bacterium]
MAKKKERKFRPRFDGNRQLLKGGRKKDSNYYRRKIKNMKMARICELLYNVEQLVIVASAVYPPFKSGLVDRLLVLALKEKVTPFVVITKTDLVQEPNLLREISAVYQQVELSFYFISNITREGLNELKPVLKNNASAVIGHSGVGKTALLNNLDASFNEKVRPVSSFTRRGRHTTNMIRRHELSFGGTVFDMPGLKEIDFIDV